MQLELFPIDSYDNQFHIYSGYDDIFGNGDAVEEPIDFLKSNFIEFKKLSFYDSTKKFMILSAPKGSGKSAMVRIWQDKLNRTPGTTSIIKYDTDISPSLNKNDGTDSIRKWKVAIIREIYKSCTKQPTNINHDFLPDRNENQCIQQYILDLYRVKNPNALNTQIPDSVNIGEKLWLFIDEFDQEFTREDRNINKIASMLLASKELCNTFRNLYIRVTIKPNVWTIVAQKRSTLSNMLSVKVEHDWTEGNLLNLYAKRIENYLKENSPNFKFIDTTKINCYKSWLMDQVFDPNQFDIGYGQRPQHKILSRYGIRRPRWMLQLCLKAANYSSLNGRISIANIEQASKEEYGNDLINSLVSEYNIQCKEIRLVLDSFMHSPEKFLGTDELAYRIDDAILTDNVIEIIGVSKKCDSLQIINFLYEIGFIEPKIHENGTKADDKFFHFTSNPDLVKNIDCYRPDTLIWEIHPAFRNHLSAGKQKYRITPVDDKKSKPKPRRSNPKNRNKIRN